MIDLNYIDYHRVGKKDKCETWAYEYNHKGQCQRTRHKTKERERKKKKKTETRKIKQEKKIKIRLDIRVSGVDIKERRMVRTKEIRKEWTVWRLGMVYGVWCMMYDKCE